MSCVQVVFPRYRQDYIVSRGRRESRRPITIRGPDFYANYFISFRFFFPFGNNRDLLVLLVTGYHFLRSYRHARFRKRVFLPYSRQNLLFRTYFPRTLVPLIVVDIQLRRVVQLPFLMSIYRRICIRFTRIFEYFIIIFIFRPKRVSPLI